MDIRGQSGYSLDGGAHKDSRLKITGVSVGQWMDKCAFYKDVYLDIWPVEGVIWTLWTRSIYPVMVLLRAGSW